MAREARRQEAGGAKGRGQDEKYDKQTALGMTFSAFCHHTFTRCKLITLIPSHSNTIYMQKTVCKIRFSSSQAAKCKWRALRHTCLLLLSVLGGMPASHQGMQARLFLWSIFNYTEKS